MSSPAVELWRHPDPDSTPMAKFMAHVNSKYKLTLKSYSELHKWSIEKPEDFWGEVWSFVGVRTSRPYDKVMPTKEMFPRPDFFQGSLLNFAENMLFPANVELDEDATAVYTVTEEFKPQATSWRELREAVRQCSNALRLHGIKPGQIVAGYVANHVESLVAMLAAATIGAIWTGISPDNGVSAVLDRLGQIQPAVLFADNGSLYNGKQWPTTPKTIQVVKELATRGLKLVVVVDNNPGIDLGLDEISDLKVKSTTYKKFLESGGENALKFDQFPPSHPLYILYSSGTTGLPKVIMHTAAGTLIQHKKEHVLHCSMSSKSRMMYFTTTSWMMWHWSMSSLAAGASIVLYAGSPFKPHGNMSMPKLISELRVTHFGMSASYLTTLECSKLQPQETLDLSHLEAIYSTASPLPPSTFCYVYEAFPKTVNLASITGGTDIISLFGAPCPLVPLYAGEIQCVGLGMAVAAVDSLTGEPVPDGEEGDLVCTVAFPSQPLTFFGEDGDAKYKAAYFERFPGVWHHGDFVRITPGTRNLVMLGRSDGVLKPSGVRFGSAEIYNVLTKFFADDVDDAICVGRRRPQDKDETVCLFVKTVEGKAWSEELRARICSTIRRELSPRHSPAIITEAGGGIPLTTNGKKIEVAVKQILSGKSVAANGSVQNPDALDWFRNWAVANA